MGRLMYCRWTCAAGTLSGEVHFIRLLKHFCVIFGLLSLAPVVGTLYLGVVGNT